MRPVTSSIDLFGLQTGRIAAALETHEKQALDFQSLASP
jgi:hypothetical protein